MLVMGLTHPGLVREENEDSHLVLADYNVFAVADGMGGHQAGAVASDLALKILKQHVIKFNQDSDPGLQLSRAVQEANRQVYEQSILDRQKQGMGTTLTAAWIFKKMAYIAHVGDSRAYLLRHNHISSITKDHSLVGELVRNGGLTEEEAQHHPQKNILMRAVGIAGEVDVDLVSLPLESKDLLFLCTDGLSNLVTADEIKEAFLVNLELHAVLKSLVDLALYRGGSDNITGLAIKID